MISRYKNIMVAVDGSDQSEGAFLKRSVQQDEMKLNCTSFR